MQLLECPRAEPRPFPSMADIDWPERGAGMTWDDLGKPSPDLWWQHLLSLRVTPPGFAGSGQRRSVFRAALEQSEQLFRAADVVNYSARPLLAFYGLAQACLAVIQASPRIAKEDTSPSGHGMKMDYGADGLGVVIAQADPRSTLALVMKATNSGGPGVSTTVERLWSSLPENRSGLVPSREQSLAPWWVGLPSSERRADIHITADTSILGGDFSSTLATMIAARPQIGELGLSTGRPGTNWYSRDDEGRCAIYFTNIDVTAVRRTLTLNSTYYDTLTPRLFASLDGKSPIHPLVVWLTILFCLSMLARYVPERWMRLLQIDGSELAPMLEDILQRANVVCPGLIVHTLDHMGVLFREGTRPIS